MAKSKKENPLLQFINFIWYSRVLETPRRVWLEFKAAMLHAWDAPKVKAYKHTGQFWQDLLRRPLGLGKQKQLSYKNRYGFKNKLPKTVGGLIGVVSVSYTHLTLPTICSV